MIWSILDQAKSYVGSSQTESLSPTYPMNPVLAWSKYQSRHDVMTTSRVEEATSPMVNTHCKYDAGISHLNARRGTGSLTAAFFTNSEKVGWSNLAQGESIDRPLRKDESERFVATYISAHEADARAGFEKVSTCSLCVKELPA
jgi:hypothetical protein